MRSQRAGLFNALLHVLQLLLQRGGFAGAAEHGFEVANGRRAAAVAEGAGAHQLKCGGAQAVVGHEDGRNIGGDQDARVVDALLQRILHASGDRGS